MKAVADLNLTVKATVELFIYANSADTSAILGIVLGNYGLNMNNFTTSFNNYTKTLPFYFLLRVRIVVFENRTFSFSVSLANFGYFLSLLSFTRTYSHFEKGHLKEFTLNCLDIDDFFSIFKLKFPNYSLKNNLPVFFSVLKSCDLLLTIT